MKVVFRVDASIKIGIGHVMRCLTLAKAMRAVGVRCVFLGREHEGNLLHFVELAGFAVKRLPRALTGAVCDEAHDGGEPSYISWLGVSVEQDVIDCVHFLDECRPDWLVVDHYALDRRWEVALREYVGKIMVIEDMASRRHDCDLLLDQNLGSKQEDYNELLPSACTRLIGPKYALLRPEFSQARSASLQRRSEPKLNRILLTMGGTDQDNVTGSVLEALEQSSLPPELVVDIVMGAGAPGLESVREKAAELRFNTSVSVAVTDMAERMCLADICIGAAGSTSWERCCLGLPTIAIVLAENQRSIGAALAGVGAVRLVERESILSELPNLVFELMSSKTKLVELSANSKELCLGDGVQLVMEYLSRDLQ